MKSDHDFLAGIYEKAERMEKMEETEAISIPKPARFFTPVGAVLTMAAALLLMMLPTALFSQSVEMVIPSGYTNLAEPQARGFAMPMMASEGGNGIFSAEIICTAKVLKIERSIYEEETQKITTTVKLQPIEIIKGAPAKTIRVLVNGGYDEATKTYLDYETVFEKGEEVLLFLQPGQGTDSYILKDPANGKMTFCGLVDGDKTFEGNDGSVQALQQITEAAKEKV